MHQLLHPDYAIVATESRRKSSLKTDVIKKRNRGAGGQSTPTSSSAAARSKKMAARKSAIAQTPATTPTSSKATESESPTSSAGNLTASNTAANTPSSYKSANVPIAPGPMRPSTSSSALQSRIVAAKRSRRRVSQSQEVEMGDAGDTTGLARQNRTPGDFEMPPPLSTSLGHGPPPVSLPTQVGNGPQEWEWLTMSL